MLDVRYVSDDDLLDIYMSEAFPMDTTIWKSVTKGGTIDDSYNIAYFNRPNDPYGVFSNFSYHPIWVDGKKYSTTEHYYQSCKCANPEDAERVRLCVDPKSAKVLATSLPMREDWETVKYKIMIGACMFKMVQNDVVYSTLEAMQFGNFVIVEDRAADPIWGRGEDYRGKNLLGRVWMHLADIM